MYLCLCLCGGTPAFHALCSLQLLVPLCSVCLPPVLVSLGIDFYLLSVSYRSPVDAMLGLPACSESRAMKSARYRNTTQQKLLQRTLTEINSQRKVQACRLLTEKCEMKYILGNLQPSKQPNAVCPFGLTPKQLVEFRLLRRPSLPSMSLQEFDRKLTDYRHEVIMSRAISDGHVNAKPEVTKSIWKRDFRRPNSRRDVTEDNIIRDVVTKTALIVPMTNESRFVSFRSQKQALKRAFERLSTHVHRSTGIAQLRRAQF
jgi:hypothetical protein